MFYSTLKEHRYFTVCFKEQAQELHKKDPKNYPDDRHKPEIAIALTNFELLCGFRTADELGRYIKGIRSCSLLHPFSHNLENIEITELFDSELLTSLLNSPPDSQGGFLSRIFSSIWKSPQENVTKTISRLIERIKSANNQSDVQKLMCRLDEQYPGGDVGVLAPIFLNYFSLNPGESTFLGPNEPHAYLSGDCIECMACSGKNNMHSFLIVRLDNTIRAGLTPKFKDVGTLCKSLTYRMSGPPYFKPNEIAPGICEYAPPVPEFAVQKLSVG